MEAIAAHVPVVIGPDMTNFADLVQLLKTENGIWQCTPDTLSNTLREILTDKDEADTRKKRAFSALHIHSGATQRSVALVEHFYQDHIPAQKEEH